MAKASDNEFPSVLFAEQGAAPPAPAAGLWRAFFQSDGLYIIDDAGAVVGPLGAAAPSGAAVAATQVKVTGGNYTLNSTAWADVDAANFALTLPAVAGDVLELGLSALGGNEAVEAVLDAASYVAGAPVNHIGTAGGGTERGVQAWWFDSGDNLNAAGSILYTVQAADIEAGEVTMRLRYRTLAASNKTLFATSAIPAHFWMKNLG